MKVKLRKTKSISRLKKEVREVFSKYIRLRDCLRTTGTLEYCNCITCSRLIAFKEAQAGHFVDCRHSPTLFDETNVHAQCARCNVYLDGEILKYRREIIRLYGEGYDVQLEEKAIETKKFTRDELLDLKELYAQKIRELLKEV
jgi:hypothetical protein